MKRRNNLLCLSLIAFLIASMSSIGSATKASPVTTVYMDPQTSSAAPGNTFEVTVTVDDVVDLFLWDITVYFSPTLLECVDAVEPYPPADQIWQFFIEEKDNTAGTLHVVGGRPFGIKEGLSGTWKLATLVFSVKAEGGCLLHFQSTELRDIGNLLIPHEAEDGYFKSPLAAPVDLVQKSAWPEKHHFVMANHGDVQMFHALVRNKGTQATTFYVVFDIWTKDGSHVDTIETVIDTLAGDMKTQKDVGWTVTAGTYKVYVWCMYDSDYDGDIDTVDLPGEKLKSFGFAVV